MKDLRKYQIKPDILSSVIDSEIVLLDVPTGKYFKIDEIGSRIWDLAKEPRTMNEIVSLLLTEYDVSIQKCEEDVRSFLDKLEEYNFILRK